MNRLLIRGEPVGPFQHLYVFENDKIVEKLGVTFEDLIDTVSSLCQKYNISNIELSGSRFYMEGIEAEIKTSKLTEYNNINDFTFKYV